MRNHRNWLMGLGIGLILGASMLQLITSAQGINHSMIAEPSIKPEQLREAAKKQGLELYPANEKRYTQDELTQEIDKAIAALPGDGSAAAGTGPSGETALKPPGGSATEPATTPTDEPSKEPETIRTLVVEYNDTFTVVAGKLKEAGIIDNAEDFMKKAAKISKKIRVGKYSFKGKPTYEEIMNELTRVK